MARGAGGGQFGGVAVAARVTGRRVVPSEAKLDGRGPGLRTSQQCSGQAPARPASLRPLRMTHAGGRPSLRCAASTSVPAPSATSVDR